MKKSAKELNEDLKELLRNTKVSWDNEYHDKILEIKKAIESNYIETKKHILKKYC